MGSSQGRACQRPTCCCTARRAADCLELQLGGAPEGSEVLVPAVLYSAPARPSQSARCDFAPHPVAQAGEDLFAKIGFVRSAVLQMLEAPWPRKQDLSSDAFRVPTADDLVIAVSHAWRYQSHPDPMGAKSVAICELAARATAMHKPKGGTLAFYDFLSVSQRPFLEGQADRTEEEQKVFGTALAAMPRVFMLADAVLHIEAQPSSQTALNDEECTYHVDCCDLDDVVLAEIGPAVHVIGRRGGNQPHGVRIAFLDYILDVNGMSVASLKDVAEARNLAHKAEAPAIAKLMRAPFGRYNKIPAGQKGWVYLERFCSMIKVAMVDESEHHHVVFSNSPSILEQIRAGGAKLREAAKAGGHQLKVVLEEFVDELKQKQFASVCADAATAGDREVVAGIMKELVSCLPEYWAPEVARQRQRQLVLAVSRGDPVATHHLLEMKGDPNVQDEQGTTCLHTAAQRGEFDVAQVLLSNGANCCLQDASGQTPAHLIGLWATADTVRLFDALALPSVLGLKNMAGVSVFDRFRVWAVTACDGQPFEPIYLRLNTAAVARPSLKGMSPKGKRYNRTLSLDGEACKRQCVRTRAGIKVEVWEPLSGHSMLSVLYLGMPMALPWAMQFPAVDLLASTMCLECGAGFFALTHGAPYGPSAGCSLLDFQAELVALIGELPLEEPLVLVDNSFGTATALLWALEPRLAGAMVINAAGYFSAEYLGSAAHAKLSEVMAQRAVERRRDRDAGALCRGSLSNYVFGEPDCLAVVGAQLHEAMAAAGDDFWNCTASTNEWMPRAITDSIVGKPAFQAPATLLCSAHAPATVIQESMSRLRELLPKAHFAHIPGSKGWWELDQPGHVVEELTALVRRATRSCR